ncbi:Uncharacterized protein APZ42_007048 [Daphnia magna]|uniref:Uncharacterized protein n=1 Tax=Daphnia magna TaxID=35525 RepID=A0A162BV38_9CRUS|nr:Uncharacterized protein APZ42_007048 [Daphnia magna]
MKTGDCGTKATSSIGVRFPPETILFFFKNLFYVTSLYLFSINFCIRQSLFFFMWVIFQSQGSIISTFST